MSIIQIFDVQGKKQFFVDEEQMLWLNGTMLCQRLGFSNPSKSIPLHVEECDRQKIDVGAINPAWFVNEPGTWSLIFEAKTPEAKNFKRDLTTKILPSIRKNRVYISPEATKEDVIKAAQDRGIELALEINDQQALLAYNAQLQNRCIDFDALD